MIGTQLRPAGPAATGRQLLVVFATCLAIQLLIYQQAFSIKPSADDYVLANQIRVGESSGLLTFFTSPPLPVYRPLESLVYWAVGRWNLDYPFRLIHALNFAAFVFYASVFALWLRLIRLPLVGVLCAIGFLSLHPVLAGPLADLDGFTRFVVSGWVWLGAYFAYTNAASLRRAIPLVALCFIIGLGFMEYAVGLVPLALLALWLRRTEGRLPAVLICGAVLTLLFAGYYLIRLSFMGAGDSARIAVNPLVWAINFGLLSVAVTFMGNTSAVYLERSVSALASAAASPIVHGLILLLGLVFFSARSELSQTNRWRGSALCYLVAGQFLSFVPMIFLRHVSEIYTTAILLPLALLTGCAIAGWTRVSRHSVVVCVTVFSIHLLWASASVRTKVTDLHDTGERADQQMRELLGWIPEETRDARVALIFLEPELPPRRTYSVFVGGDDHLIQPGLLARAAIEWYRPGKNIQLVHLVVRDKTAIALDAFDVALHWNPTKREFEALELSHRRPSMSIARRP